MRLPQCASPQHHPRDTDRAGGWDVSACRHPPRQWHFGELMPCADPLCSDTTPGSGLVMLFDDCLLRRQVDYVRKFWVDPATGYRHWFWVSKPGLKRVVSRRRKRPKYGDAPTG
jgi:hypothetical protein